MNFIYPQSGIPDEMILLDDSVEVVATDKRSPLGNLVMVTFYTFGNTTDITLYLDRETADKLSFDLKMAKDSGDE